ncbi:MAG TPA: cytochrome b N-terminal domain-containing protein [Bryobacteraceae bacterium]|nr:cytochrome b N-terminal domain-containing protein [Bryobacteraceae bacterium]
MRKIIDWLEHRTGIETAVKSFLYEEIPASSGWHQVIGSMALFFFMIQGVTGILLAFNYAPTPGEAYNSLHYIMTEVTGGRFIRGLHHWGASMMIVVVVLHMLQVFLFGAYKKPREATWMMGVVLLLVTLAFGLTGYLLPWDNRAYWGTVVTTQITGGAPVLGPYLQRLLGGEGVGVVTFARFFAAHVVLLPPLTLILIGIHVYLVRKHGVAPIAEETAPPKKFYPEQVFKDTVAFAIAFIALVLMAAFVEVPLERLADPTDTTYIPRPEWYFLFLFQMLKAFKGPLEVVGSTVLPGIAVLILFCVPFIDRAPMVRLGKRVFAFAVAGFALLGWGALTTVAYVTTPKNPEGGRPPEFNAAQLSDWQKLTPAELAGVAFFRSENCIACHLGPGQKGTGPDLTKIPDTHRNAAWLVMHFKEPAEVVPGSAMPPVRLRDSELNSLALLVMKFTPENEAELLSAPAEAVRGAVVYTNNHCTACHQLQGSGQKVGPPLDGVGDRHDRKWLEDHFRNPSALSKGSKMPAYKFNDADMEAICNYLLQMP